MNSNLQQMIKCKATKWNAYYKNYWRQLYYLSSRGIAFQGENTQIGNAHNGNYLGILELIGRLLVNI